MATKKTTAKAKVSTPSAAKASKAAKKPAVKKAPAAKKAPAVKKAPAKKAAPPISPEQRYRMIEQAAYYLAEKTGFQGDPAAIWVQAEKDVEAQIASGRL